MRPFAFKIMKTIVYIDGFNLFYQCLKRTQLKWLNIHELCKAALPDSNEIIEINFYTARVSGRFDSNSPAYQQRYLNALTSLPSVKVHYGKFMHHEVWMRLVQPPEFTPRFTAPLETVLDRARVHKTEEKGSDVNLGVHLVRDAALKRMDCAAILTNDTDLCEPVRIANQEFGLPVVLLTPTNRPTRTLKELCTSMRHIEPYLRTCQFPANVTAANGKLAQKPAEW